MDEGMSYIQNGWRVRTSDGHDLGTVIESSRDSMIVRADDGRRRTIPKDHIDEEDESAMLAILSIDADDLDDAS